jgi:hypothetical protein
VPVEDRVQVQPPMACDMPLMMFVAAPSVTRNNMFG